MRLLGAERCGSIAVTNDELKALQRLYNVVPESPTPKPEPPVAPQQQDFKTAWEYKGALQEHERALKQHEKWEDPQSFLQAGADRNVFRHAEADGLRIVAWLARYLSAGQDPLQQVVQLAVQAGWDVDYEDVDWSEP